MPLRRWSPLSCLPFLAVPINWSSMARICSDADISEGGAAPPKRRRRWIIPPRNPPSTRTTPTKRRTIATTGTTARKKATLSSAACGLGSREGEKSYFDLRLNTKWNRTFSKFILRKSKGLIMFILILVIIYLKINVLSKNTALIINSHKSANLLLNWYSLSTQEALQRKTAASAR